MLKRVDFLIRALEVHMYYNDPRLLVEDNKTSPSVQERDCGRVRCTPSLSIVECPAPISGEDFAAARTILIGSL